MSQNVIKKEFDDIIMKSQETINQLEKIEVTSIINHVWKQVGEQKWTILHSNALECRLKSLAQYSKRCSDDLKCCFGSHIYAFVTDETLEHINKDEFFKTAEFKRIEDIHSRGMTLYKKFKDTARSIAIEDSINM